MDANRVEVIAGHLKKKEWNLIPEDTASTKYEYTLDASTLTDEQRQFYEDNGYFVVKNLIPPHEIEMYRKRFQEICLQQVKIPDLVVMRDITFAKTKFVPGEKYITTIHHFYNDPVLFSYCHNPKILQYVEGVIGPDIMAAHTTLINQLPDSGKKTSRHPLHQDLPYSFIRPVNSIVTCWTAMQKVNRSNGCLAVLPGTHKGGLKKHVYPEWKGGVNKMCHGIADFDEKSPRVHLEMEVGDTVFFHPLLIHGSGTNITDGYRKAISTRFASSRCEYFEPEGTIQENISGEVLQLAKRVDVGITIRDIVNRRYKVVRGQPKDLYK